MSKVRVATCVPRQYWMQSEKLGWLQKALREYPCDLFISSQELFGGGSTREICRLKGIETDDVPVTEDWLNRNIGGLARKHNTCIGIGASVKRHDVVTEDFLYYDNEGTLLGYHSKIALPVQDSIALGGASGITPETSYERAVKVIEIPKLGLRVGTVFCWQVFFVDFWNDLMRQGCNLVAHPIKFAPRAWYKKGQNAANENTRIGFTQNKGSEKPEDDTLGWIRKLMFESEFKQMPIAVTCNTWNGGEQFLALVGWVDEVTRTTNLLHLPSVAETDQIVVTEYDPALYDALPNWNKQMYAQFKKEYETVAEKTMMRKAIRLERQARDGRAAEKLTKHAVKKAVEKAVVRSSRSQQATYASSLSSFFDNF
jgi:Carbon-nitrogen hydrolase